MSNRNLQITILEIPDPTPQDTEFATLFGRHPAADDRELGVDQLIEAARERDARREQMGMVLL